MIWSFAVEYFCRQNHVCFWCEFKERWFVHMNYLWCKMNNWSSMFLSMKLLIATQIVLNVQRSLSWHRQKKVTTDIQMWEKNDLQMLMITSKKTNHWLIWWQKTKRNKIWKRSRQHAAINRMIHVWCSVLKSSDRTIEFHALHDSIAVDWNWYWNLYKWDDVDWHKSADDRNENHFSTYKNRNWWNCSIQRQFWINVWSWIKSRLKFKKCDDLTWKKTVCYWSENIAQRWSRSWDQTNSIQISFLTLKCMYQCVRQ